MEFLSTTLIVYGAFLLIVFALLLAPFIPAWREFSHPTDCSPLPISADYATDILYFARKFRSEAEMAAVENDATTPVKFLRLTEEFQLKDHAASPVPIFAANSIRIDQAIELTSPMYAAGNFRGSDGCTFKAIYTCGSLLMGKAFRLIHWAHAEGAIAIQEDSIILGRMSSATGMQIGTHSCFERLYAPTILFGPLMKSTSRQEVPALGTRRYASLPHASHRTDSLYMVHGNCTLAASSVYHGSLIVKGDLTIGEHTRVVGDIKVKGNVVISRGANVDGAVIGERSVEIDKGVHIKGPVLVQRMLQVGSESVIGTRATLTSVIGKEIVIHPGVIIHGTMRARHVGMVLS